MSHVDGITFKFIEEEDIAEYEDEVESRYYGYGVVYDYKQDGELFQRYRPDKLKLVQAVLKSNDAFLLIPFTTRLPDFQIIWAKRFWGGSYRKLICKYCGGDANGNLEVAIRSVIAYRRPPRGAKELKVKSDSFYVFKAQSMLAHCSKCGLESQT